MKRFIVRKIQRKSYTRQGWLLKKTPAFGVFDREWRKNKEASHSLFFDGQDFKYIDTSSKKEVAQFWADWLNENRNDSFGRKIMLPHDVFHEGLELYQKVAENG